MRWRIGDCIFDKTKRQVSGPVATHLNYRQGRLLEFLIENYGQAYKDKEMIRAVWEGQSAEGSLHKYIAVLRNALGGERKSYIDTDPYRLIVEPERLDDDELANNRGTLSDVHDVLNRDQPKKPATNLSDVQISGPFAKREHLDRLHDEDFRSWVEELLRVLHPTGDSQNSRNPNDDGGLQEELADVIPPQIKSLMDEGRSLTEQGRYEAAGQKFSAALEAAEATGCAMAAIDGRIEIAENQLLMQRDIGNARDALQSCLVQLPKTDRKRRQVVLTLLGNAEAIIGNIESAQSIYREGKKLAHEQHDRFGEALDLIGLSFADEMHGNLNEAHLLLDEAEEVFQIEYLESQGDAKRRCAANIGACLASKASLYRKEGNVAEALVNLSKAEHLFREANSLDNLGRTLFMKSKILLSDASWEPGVAILTEALSTFESIGNISWQCHCLELIARLSITFDNKEQALSSIERAVGLALSGERERESVPHLLDLARLCDLCGAPEMSGTLIGTAQEIAITADDNSLSAECLLAEADTTRKPNDKSHIRNLLESALKYLEAVVSGCEIKARRAEYMLKIGEVHGRLGDLNEAKSWGERSLHEFEEIGDVAGTGNCLSYLIAVTRRGDLDTESAAFLERLLNLTKGKRLHHLRACALHDLGRMKLSQGDTAGARECLDEAAVLAKKHKLQDVLDVLEVSLERVANATRFYQPPDRDFAMLLDELRTWCGLYPRMKEAILPLWYYIHRTELWSICRSLLGVKYLICAPTIKSFGRIADLFSQHGDLFVFGTSFILKKEKRTELVPWPDDVLIPPEMKIVAFKGPPGDTATTARAVVNALGKEKYVLIPFSGTLKQFPDTQMCAFGRHVRFPAAISKMALQSAEHFGAERKICLPLGEGARPIELLHTMLVAWENKMIPVLSPRIPHGAGVEAVCDTSVIYPMSLPQSTNHGLEDSTHLRSLWEKLLSSISEVEQRMVLLEFARDVGAVMAGQPAGKGIRTRMYILRFRAGQREVVHPAIVVPSA